MFQKKKNLQNLFNEEIKQISKHILEKTVEL